MLGQWVHPATVDLASTTAVPGAGSTRRLASSAMSASRAPDRTAQGGTTCCSAVSSGCMIVLRIHSHLYSDMRTQPFTLCPDQHRRAGILLAPVPAADHGQLAAGRLRLADTLAGPIRTVPMIGSKSFTSGRSDPSMNMIASTGSGVVDRQVPVPRRPAPAWPECPAGRASDVRTAQGRKSVKRRPVVERGLRDRTIDPWTWRATRPSTSTTRATPTGGLFRW